MPWIRQFTKPLVNLYMGRPLLAIFEVCLRCNSACGYCNLPLNESRYEMTREEIRCVFSDLYQEGLRFLFVQGGEPLVRRDFSEMLEDLAELGFNLTLITNGTKFTETLVERLISLQVSISISVGTLNRQPYRRIRGRDQLPEVLHGIKFLKNYPHPKYLTCIVSNLNRHDAIDIARFARARGFIPVIGAYHWDVDRYGNVDLTLQYARPVARKVFEEILDSGLVPPGYFRRYLRDNIDWLDGKSMASCDAGTYSMAIDASGHVAPCLALTHAGNLLDTSLPDIVAKFDKDSIRSCSNKSSCNMLCSRVIGSVLGHPLEVFHTPQSVTPSGVLYAG